MGFDEDVAAKLVIRRHMTQAADDLEDHRFSRIEVSRSAADVAGIELYLVQALASFFAGDFDEVQSRHAENPSLGAVHSRFTDQNLQNLIAFQRLGHVDEVDDDDAADIAQAQLAGDFDGRFFIDVKNRILKSRPVPVYLLLLTSMTVKASV